MSCDPVRPRDHRSTSVARVRHRRRRTRRASLVARDHGARACHRRTGLPGHDRRRPRGGGR